ncbi:flagellar hook-basal body protein [Salimicrobium jeotgali]|uniref:Flagellar hook-basal body protein n=2 Tax=Salimicrobium jeotgali TaxID=1230341 RepID=K2H6K6_9BACI|nr:flagellar hook-basal body protein [Salimicrobium jeotgali]EKE31405.1 flagellar hook-basal body protein [Salimicrobium jeotgali]MBM7697015.1 flagellar basal-body rod protein FlgG [Salimicrobium jeotgali]
MVNRAMMQSAVTMGQVQRKLDIIGQNISNANTAGYKSRQADFTSLLTQNIDNLKDKEAAVGRRTPDGIRLGSGARLGHTNLDLKQGTVRTTDRELDLALLKERHLFRVQVPTEAGNETQYTRAGNFYFLPVENDQLMLTTGEGHPVLGEDGEEIRLDNGFDDFTIRGDGSISVKRGDREETEASIGIAEAIRPRMLETTEGNRFRLPDTEALGFNEEEILAAVQNEDRSVRSNSLEASNVDTGQQMTGMLQMQRAYQFNARALSTSDEMMGLVNQLRS